MTETAFFVAMIVGFALAMTAHVTIAFGLFFRPPRYRGLLVLLVLPLAPYWALRERMRFRAIVWMVATAVYAGARLLA